MNNFTIKLFLLSLFITNVSFAQNYQWAKNIGSSAADKARDITTDASGNVYITGTFSGAADFDPGAGTATLTPVGTNDLFIAKYNASGVYQWAINVGVSNTDGFSVVVDGNGDIYATGQFYGSVDFDPTAGTSTLASNGLSDVFFTKYDASGTFLWAKSFGSVNADIGRDIKIDGNGDLYITGAIEGSTDFDPSGASDVIANINQTDIFFAKYDADGLYQWAKVMGGSGSDYGYGMAIDASGNLFIAGLFTGTTDFDPSGTTNSITSVGSDDAFFAKYDVNGNYLWAKNIGSASADAAYKIALDPAGNCYVTGYYQAVADFDAGAGTVSITPTGTDDVFFTKYSSNGNYIWAKSIGGTGDYDTGSDIAVDALGNTYLTGRFSGTADFDPSSTATANLVSAGLKDIYIAKYDANGNYNYATKIGSAGDDYGLSVTVDDIGNSYVSGYFRNTVDFNPGTGTANLTAVGNLDIFFAKYAHCNVAVTTTNVSCAGGNNGTASAVASEGTPPYTYSWNTAPVQTTANITGLVSGNYTVTVTDAASNVTTSTITIINASVAPNTWVQKADFGGVPRQEAVGFSIGNKGYIGTGSDGGFKKDFWEWDPNTNVWTQKADFGGSPRNAATGIVIGNKGYIGLGFDGSSALNDFWEYDPIANIWNAKANFTGGARYGAVGFSIGNKGYVGTGQTQGASYFSDLYEYDPITNLWTPKASLGVTRSFAVSFAIGSKGYITTGYNGSDLRDLLEYNPVTNNWTQKTDLPGTARYGGAGFAIGSRGYVGTGFGATYYQDLYEWDQTTDTWATKAGFPGNTRFQAVGFAVGNRGYFGTGNNASTKYGDFYEYTVALDVTATAQTNAVCSGAANGSATATATGGTSPYSYSWNTNPVQNSATATGLAVGTYAVTVTDCSGATDVTTVSISQAGTPNTWVQKASFPLNTRYGGVAFSIGQKGYFGTGTSPTAAYNNDFWEFDPATNVWTQKADVAGNPRHYAVGFSIGSKGYIGTGEDNTTVGTKDFFEYNPVTNIWTPKASLVGVRRVSAVGFSIGNKGYIGTGQDGATKLNDFWEYNPSTNQWTQKANFSGGTRGDATGFSIENNGYIATGRNSSGNYLRDCWQYNPAIDVWTQKADVGALVRGNAVSFSIGSKGFLGTGSPNGGAGCYDDFYEYNPQTDIWTQRANFLGTAVNWAFGFSIGNKGYIGAGYDGAATLHNEFYEYTSLFYANISTQTNVNCNGGSNGTATATIEGGTPPYSFSWNTNPVQNSATATGLSPGTYTVTITECSGSTATASVTITESGVPDSWTQKASFIGVNRSSGVGFSIGSKGYFGTGENSNGVTEYNDFWEYDPITNVWTQKANFGGVARKGATGFSIGNKGYLGIGHDNSTGFHNDFWEYNPSTNAWVQKANFPPIKRYNAVGFSIGSKGYMGTGYENQSTGSFIWYSDFFEYDPSNDSWTQKTNVPGAVRGAAVGFSIGAKGYVGTGASNNTAGGLLSDFYEYNPINNTWTQKANYGGGVINSAVGFSVGGKGYIGTGSDASVFRQDLWEWNPLTDTWIQKADFGGSARYSAEAFVIDTKAYVMKGYDGAQQQDLWEYNPSTNAVIASYTSANNGQTVTFTNNSTNATSYVWHFGDGTTSTSQNPIHTYNYGGSFNVCLFAYGNCTGDTICNSIAIGCTPPIANYTKTTNGLTANFTNTSVNGSTYLWNFGDGNTATTFNASHVYNASGTYTVTLTSTNGCGTNIRTNTVTVTCVAPNAAFTSSVNGLTVSFTNTSTNAANSLWEFGDGNTSTSNSPVYVYNNTGLYNVILHVSNACGTDTITESILVSCALPVANFVNSVNGLTAEFVSTSTDATTYNWDFDDGGTSISPYPAAHNYANTGTYNVCLNATNGCGTSTRCDSVIVCAPPVADFTTSSNALNTTFTYTGTQGTDFFWTFGDGNANNTTNTTQSHTYATSGWNEVCLNASNTCGSSSKCDSVFLYCTNNIAQNLCLVTVDDLSTHNIVMWEKPIATGIDSFRIYRVQTALIDDLIGSVAYDSLSEFHDYTCDPNITQYDYKVAVLDSCGNEGPKSLAHRTILMTTSLGFNQCNLQWNLYVGNPVNQYHVWRDDNLNGVWTLLTSLSPASTTYIDNNWPTSAAWRYRIDVDWVTSCTPTAKTTAATNTTRSNTRDNYRVTGLSQLDANSVTLFPNPASELVNVNLNANAYINNINVIDATGRLVKTIASTNKNNQAQINTSDLARGIYFIEVNTNAGIVRKSFVRE